MDYILSRISKYYGVFEDYEDLLQEALIAFTKAIYSYDFKGYFLKQFAAIRIYNATTRYVFSNLHRITDEEKRYELVKDFCDRVKRKIGREPNYRDIVIYNGLEVNHAKEIIYIYNMKNIYMDYETHKDDEFDYTLSDVERFVDSDNFGSLIKDTDYFKLTKRQKEIILLRYGFSDGEFHSLPEIAKLLKMSKQGANNIEFAALKNMRKVLKR